MNDGMREDMLCARVMRVVAGIGSVGRESLTSSKPASSSAALTDIMGRFGGWRKETDCATIETCTFVGGGLRQARVSSIVRTQL
jgi:hypothetical protein